MTLITVDDSDMIALGGPVPRTGFIQVYRVNSVGGRVEQQKVAQYSLRGEVSFEVDPAEAQAHRLQTMAAGDLDAQQWFQVVPGVDTIKLSVVVKSPYSIDPKTLGPLVPFPPSAQDVLTQATTAVTVATGAAGDAQGSAADADAAKDAAAGHADDAEAALADLTSQKGAPSGIAPLDGSGKLPEPQVPDRLSEASLSSTYGTRADGAVTYDSAGRKETFVSGGNLFTLTYDAQGRMDTKTGAGSVWTYTYDAAGRLVNVERADA